LVGWTVRPGFLPQVVRCERGFQLNIDLVHLIVRPETALEAYQYVHTRSKHGDETYKSFITGSHVVTSYNNRIYRITDVEFPFSPATIFAFKDGVHTFKEFYEQVETPQFLSVK
jgi:aubergine